MVEAFLACGDTLRCENTLFCMEIVKRQKMSEVSGLAYRFSGVQSSSQEQSSLGNYNREKRVCTVSENQSATNEEKQDEEKCGPL